MIAATLFGGLGNQMFIYATVKALSLHYQVPMAFNLNHGFANDYKYHRKLELCKFNCQLPTAKWITFDYRGELNIKRISRRIGRNLLCPNYQFVIEEEPFHYEKRLFEFTNKNIFLEGYWQSPYYFENYSKDIRADFQLKVPLSKEVLEEIYALKATGKTLVMLGIRRYQEVEGRDICTYQLCDEEYYTKAITYIQERIPNALFVVFTQDKEWATTHLPKGAEFYFVKDKQDEYATVADMFLMTQCTHAIISNSTCYWWGAWLQCTTKNHIVIAPDSFINSDCVCKEWIILKRNSLC